MGLRVIGDKLRLWGNNYCNKLGISQKNEWLDHIKDIPLPAGMTNKVNIKAYKSFVAFTDGNKLWLSGCCYLNESNKGITTGITLISDKVKKFYTDGDSRFFYVTTTGEVYSWGHDEFSGTLGIGSVNYVYGPKRVSISGVVSDIFVNDSSTFFTTTNSVFVCGCSVHYSLGLANGIYNTPRSIQTGVQIIKIVSNYNRTYMIDSGNNVYIIGEDYGGSLGGGTCTNSNDRVIIKTPTSITSMKATDITVVRAGAIAHYNGTIKITGSLATAINDNFNSGWVSYSLGVGEKINYNDINREQFITTRNTSNGVMLTLYHSGKKYQREYRKLYFLKNNIRIAGNISDTKVVKLEFYSSGINENNIIDNYDNIVNNLKYCGDYWIIAGDYLYKYDNTCKFYRIDKVSFPVLADTTIDTYNTTKSIFKKNESGNFYLYNYNYGEDSLEGHNDCYIRDSNDGMTNRIESCNPGVCIANNLYYSTTNGNCEYYLGGNVSPIEKREYIPQKLKEKIWLPVNTSNERLLLPSITINAGNDYENAENAENCRFRITPSQSGENPILIESVVTYDDAKITSIKQSSGVDRFDQKTINELKNGGDLYVAIYDKNGYIFHEYKNIILQPEIVFSNHGNTNIITPVSEGFEVRFTATLRNCIGSIDCKVKLINRDNNVSSTINQMIINSGDNILYKVSSSIIEGLTPGGNYTLRMECRNGNTKNKLDFTFSLVGIDVETGPLHLGEKDDKFDLFYTARLRGAVGKIKHLLDLNGNKQLKYTNSGEEARFELLPKTFNNTVDQLISVDCSYNSVKRKLEYTFTRPIKPPIISGEDCDLGTFLIIGPTIEYSIQDSSNGPVKIEFVLDGKPESDIRWMNDGDKDVYNFRNYLPTGKHTFEIIATNGLGGKSIRTYTFIIEIEIPVISGEDSHLGDISVPPKIEYIVYDNSNTDKYVRIELDGSMISYEKIEVGKLYSYTPNFGSIENGEHVVVITASNPRARAIRTYTFTKINRDIIFSNYSVELGVKNSEFTCNYTVNNSTLKTLTGEILLDGQVIETMDIVPQDTQNTVTIRDEIFQQLEKSRHVITVRCSDVNVTRQIEMRFTRGNNAPLIQEGDMDLGEIFQLLPFDLTIIDGDKNDPLTMTISNNGTVIKTYNGLKSGNVIKVNIESQFNSLPLGKNQFDIEITDGELSSSSKIVFTKIRPPFKVEMDLSQIGEILYELNNIKYTVRGDSDEQFYMDLVVDGRVKHNFTSIQNGIQTTYSCPQSIIDSIPKGKIELIFRFVSITSGRVVSLYFDVRKVYRRAEFIGKDVVLAPRASRIFFNSISKIAPRATISVFATNNAGDKQPVWENVTKEFVNGDYYIFSNRNKSTEKYIVNIKIIIDVGTSKEYSYISKLMYSVD